MGPLMTEHLAALFDGQFWRDNPLAMRDARREARRNRLFTSILTLGITLLVLGVFGAWILYEIVAYSRHVPYYLGGNLGTALAIFVSGIHFWSVVRMAQKRVAKMLVQEASVDGMTSMLMLPITRFQFLLQAAVYPWFSGMLIAVLLLPIYLFCVGTGGLTWAELFALYTLFALVAMALPSLRRPALSGNIVSLLTNPVDNDSDGEESGGSLFKRRVWRRWLMWIVASWMIPIILMLLILAMFGAGGGATAWLQPYVPMSILELIPSLFLSAPLVATRVLITPFGWFSTAILPLPFVVFLTLTRKYLQMVQTSEYLSVGTYRDLALQPSYLPRRRMELLWNLVLAVVVTGYLWPWAVRDEGLGFLSMHPGGPNSGLQGFLFLVGFVAVWWGWIRAGQLGSWMFAFGPKQQAETLRVVAGRSAALFLLTPLLFCLGYGVCCLLLSGAFGMPAGMGLLLLKVLAVGAAGILFNFGWRRLTGDAGVLGCLVVIFVLWGPSWLHPLRLLCPTLGLFDLEGGNLWNMTARGNPLEGAPSWTQWILVAFAVGSVLTLIAWSAAYRLRAPNRDEERPAFDPTLVGREVFADVEANRRAALEKTDSPLSLAIVRVFQNRVDNAVAVRELRSRLRNRISTGRVVGVFAACLAITLIGFLIPSFAGPGTVFTQAFHHNLTSGSKAEILANIQGCFYWALTISAFLCGYGVLPRAFGIERQKSTLSFVLISPMSTPAIVWGKALGLILANSMSVWALGIWTLALSIPLTLMTGSFAPFVGWLETMLSALIELCAIAMIMLALGSMFPQLATARLNGCVRLLVLYMVYQVASILLFVFFAIAETFHLGPYVMWVESLMVGLSIIIIAGLFSYLAVQGMRKGDIDIKLAKKKV